MTGKWLIAASLLAPVALQAQSNQWSAVDTMVDRAGGAVNGGVELVLIGRGGKEMYRRQAGGWARDRRVPVASATKWLAGAVIMALADRGKLKLDDTVGKYFPEVDAAKAPITVRQLMSHTSGIEPDQDCIGSNARTLETCASAILAQPLAAVPGTVLAYGGASMQVAGRIAEIAAGKSWNELFEELIAEPLGLEATDFGLNGQDENPRIAGGARSHATDYSRFLAMLLNQGAWEGASVLAAASAAEMMTDQTRGARIVSTPYSNYGELNPLAPLNRYGIGNWIEVLDEELTPGVNSSAGAFGCIPWIDRERGYAAVLMAQNTLRNVMPFYYPLREEIERLFDGDEPPAPAPSGLRLRSMPVNGVVRSFYEYLPRGYEGSRQYPLLLALHGGLGSGLRFANQTGYAELADREGLIVVFPNGSPSGRGEGSFVWNAYQPGSPNDLLFLSELIDYMTRDYRIDLGRVYLTGFSNGAMMSFRLACEMPWRFAAAAPVSGSWKFGPHGYDGESETPCNPQWTIPMQYMRGTEEASMPTRDTEDEEAVEFWRAFQACPQSAEPERLLVNGERLQRLRFQPCRDNVEVWSLDVIGNAHEWHASATDLTWSFFRRYRRGEGFQTVTVE